MHLHGLQYSCRFQTVMQTEKTCCFLSPLSLSENQGVFARMIITGSTDRITSADATHRPESICLFSSRPSRGREETSACHGSNGDLEGGCPQTSKHFPPCTLQKYGQSTMQQMQCNANPEHRISAKMRRCLAGAQRLCGVSPPPVSFRHTKQTRFLLDECHLPLSEPCPVQCPSPPVTLSPCSSQENTAYCAAGEKAEVFRNRYSRSVRCAPP